MQLGNGLLTGALDLELSSQAGYSSFKQEEILTEKVFCSREVLPEMHWFSAQRLQEGHRENWDFHTGKRLGCFCMHTKSHASLLCKWL